MLRAVHGSTVLYPCDGTSAAALVLAMADREGISYMRTTRGAYPVLYGAAETFPVGGSKVLRQTDADQVALIGAGVTLHECLAAADQLAADGISARVIDLYSVKPADTATLSAAAAATGGRLVIAEDHHPEGGLGSAVLDALTGASTAPTWPSPTWPSARCPAPALPPNSSAPPASTPPTSPKPPAACSRTNRRSGTIRGELNTRELGLHRAERVASRATDRPNLSG